MKKRFTMGIVVLLTLTLIGLTACGDGAGGGGGGGDPGSEDNPFIVDSLATLLKVGSGNDGWTLEASYKQIDDINISSVTNWTPIGTASNPFEGTYDGGNYTITGLKISRNNVKNQGLFGYVVSGAISNVNLTDVNIAITNTDGINDHNVGGIAGWLLAGTISNCSVSGSVSGYDYVGGIVGDNQGTVRNCHVDGDVSCGHNYVGGIAGFNAADHTVENCSTTCTVTSNDTGSNDTGGVVALNWGTVKNCYATGNITGSTYVGGVVGDNSDGNVSNCYATGTVTGITGCYYVGGVVGASTGTVEKCYHATGSVIGWNYVGGVVGDNIGGSVSNCYATGNITGNGNVGGVVGASTGTVEKCYHAAGDVGGSYGVGGVAGGSTGTLRYCVALSGQVTATTSDAGRVIGSSLAGTVTPNYSLDSMTVSCSGSVTNAVSGTSISASWAKTQSNYTSMYWDFTTVWIMGSTYPVLR